MSGKANRAGQPLIVLLALLAGWTAARVMSWEPPVPAAMAGEQFSRPVLTTGNAGPGMVGPQSFGYVDYGARFAGAAEEYGGVPVAVPFGVGTGYPMALMPGASLAGRSEPGAGRFENYVIGDFPGIPAGNRAGASAAGRSALAAQPYPDSVARAPAPPLPAAPVRPRRWSADAWAFLRSGGSPALANGQLPATYGGSQAGAVLRYRFLPRDARRPEIYLRTTSTLGMVQETAAAVGVAARPAPRIPVTAGLEARVTDQAGERRVQPAIMAISELPPLALAQGMRGEIYAQAGYVAGKYATPFADGLVRVDRRLFDVGQVQARFGAGAWAGFQKGVSRVDLGPSANVTMPLGKATHGRIALDWRFRVTGNAEPDSGPSVTLSAGF